MNILSHARKKLFESATPFQIQDAIFLQANKKAVLGHRTGLGKTFISALAWSQIADIETVLLAGSLS